MKKILTKLTYLAIIVLIGFSFAYGGSTFSRIKTWSTGETLTASQLNAEFNNILNNLDPTGIDDESADDAAAQATSDPYPGSSLTKATSLETEIQQLRYLIAQITGETYWYIDSDTNIAAIVANDWVTNARIVDDALDSEHYTDGSIDIAHLSADCVDDTKIGDAKIKKEHLNTDVAGAGLAGGAGTALSVDGINDAGGTELKVKIVNIGDWNMDSTSTLAVAHGLTATNIRNIQVTIRNDANSQFLPLNYAALGDGLSAGNVYADATNIQLGRKASGTFDSANYDSTSYNRGWITIWYIV